MTIFPTEHKAKLSKHIKQFIVTSAIPILLGSLLSGCGVNPAINTNQNQSYQFVHTVSLETGDSVAMLEKAYGGQVIAWHPEAGFAVIASNQDVRGKKPNTTITDKISSVQPNTDVILMAEGRISVFGSGRISVFGSGTEAYGLIGNLTAWSDSQRTGWLASTVDIGYGTVSFRNLSAFTGSMFDSKGSGGIRLPGAQKLAPKLGQGVKVAIIDSGVDLLHPGLIGVKGDATQPNHLAPSSNWKDFVDGDLTPQEALGLTNEAYGHGTGVAGIVLQIAPKATIMPIRVLASDGTGDASNLVGAIQWAVDHGAQIINLSLGTTDRVDAVAAMITWATSQGVYVVSAAGNTNDTNVLYPAADALDKTRGGAKLIGVGSVGSGNVIGAYLGGTTTTSALRDRNSVYSAYGSKLEMVAPGELVTTLLPEASLGDWTGTSFAAPMVSAALALALAEPLTTSQKALVDDAITSSAINIDACNPGFVGQLGKGRLDVEAFMRKVLGQAINSGTACP